MFYWIYDVPSFLVVALFVTVFVGACFLGTLFLRPRRRWATFSSILASFTAYCSAFLRWRHTKTTRMPRGLSATKHQLSPRCTETFPFIRNPWGRT